MDQRKIIGLLGDIAAYATVIWALDGIGKFYADYKDTKARVEALEQGEAALAAAAIFQPATASETKTTRTNDAALGESRRPRTAKTKPEPRDAVPDEG